MPTPVVFREARKYGAGIVISSSHNPLEWNGMKFIIEGRGINERELPQIIEHQDVLEKKYRVGNGSINIIHRRRKKNYRQYRK